MQGHQRRRVRRADEKRALRLSLPRLRRILARLSRQDVILSEGKTYFVKTGDIVCTKAGDEHDVLEVYEDFEAFWFEDPCPPNGSVGHLHRDGEKAKGHTVPAKPLPTDFPA